MDRHDDQYQREGERMGHVREENGWGQYKLLVVHELKRLNDELTGIRADIQQIDRDLLTLKVKASIWGAVAGFAVSLVPVIVRILLVAR